VIGYFFARRILHLIKKQKHKFFISFFAYIPGAIMAGVPLEYAGGYFLQCGGENLTS